MEFIMEKNDFRQYRKFRRHSITHYLTEFINCILSQQDHHDQKTVLACMVDFSKAFNRQNHHIHQTELCKLGWLLRIVIAFLTKREMVVSYNWGQSKSKVINHIHHTHQ